MSGDNGEQQQLSDAVEVTESKTRHQQIIELYNGETLTEIAAGFWGKMIIEFLIIAVPIGVVLIPAGFALAFLNIGPVTYGAVLALWVTFSTSIFGFTWCYTESPMFRTDESEESESGWTQEG